MAGDGCCMGGHKETETCHCGWREPRPNLTRDDCSEAVLAPSLLIA